MKILETGKAFLYPQCAFFKQTQLFLCSFFLLFFTTMLPTPQHQTQTQHTRHWPQKTDDYFLCHLPTFLLFRCLVRYEWPERKRTKPPALGGQTEKGQRQRALSAALHWISLPWYLSTVYKKTPKKSLSSISMLYTLRAWSIFIFDYLLYEVPTSTRTDRLLGWIRALLQLSEWNLLPQLAMSKPDLNEAFFRWQLSQSSPSLSPKYYKEWLALFLTLT